MLLLPDASDDAEDEEDEPNGVRYVLVQRVAASMFMRARVATSAAPFVRREASSQAVSTYDPAMSVPRLKNARHDKLAASQMWNMGLSGADSGRVS